MNPKDALRQATYECQQFEYDWAELRKVLNGTEADGWDTPKELEHDKKGLCRDFAIWTIVRAYDLANDPKPDYRLVVGQMPDDGWHAWVEWFDSETNEAVVWADPTPGYRCAIDEPSWFLGRRPHWTYHYNGVGFDEKFAYVPGGGSQ